MSDPETFLSRWSRRKREALRDADTGADLRPNEAADSSLLPCDADVGTGPRGTSAPRPADPSPRPSPTRGEGVAAARQSSALPANEPALDPATLPPIDSITAQTDIRAFLAPGVPPELTRAALRRAWACDPAIRNFVGLADYDWDFNAADSMAGFGPLQITDDVANMATQILDPSRSGSGACHPLDPVPTTRDAEQIADESNTATTHGAVAEIHHEQKDRNEHVNEIGMSAHSDELTRHEHGDVAVQYTSTKPENRTVLVRRQHGGALPK